MNTTNKYEILKNNTIVFEGKTLYQIRAVKDFGYVRKGQEGGYIEKEDNLSQTGECWVHYSCMAMDNASIRGNAILEEKCIARDNAFIQEDAYIYDGVEIKDEASISGKCVIRHGAVIEDKASVYGSAKVQCEAKIGGTAVITDDAFVEYCEINKGRINHQMFVNENFEDIMFFSFGSIINVTALKIQEEWLFNIDTAHRPLLTKSELINEISRYDKYYDEYKDVFLHTLTLF